MTSTYPFVQFLEDYQNFFLVQAPSKNLVLTLFVQFALL
jgi:hypothetical protein